ncbi:hypothetical protein GCM10023258_37450 [Terrabacter aeriphilus]|uniref:DUF222 domain-containing protein n=1 Tax=Terrabacter aeriphilus TaxID=515662 RepID=A0ABP9JLA3_9MICO
MQDDAGPNQTATPTDPRGLDAGASVEAVRTSIEAAATALAASDPTRPREALPLLRRAQEHLTAAIDEAMAAALVADGGTIRTTGALAGLSENAVGPRLARTRLLAAYGTEAGRVTATGVERARYDLEQGRHRPAPAPAPTDPPAPMRFRARRPSAGGTP